MKIVYACYGAFQPQGRWLTSDMASMRYRALIPARYLAQAGHEVQVVTTGEAPWEAAALARLEAHVLVVSKSFSPATEGIAAALQRRGARVVVDVCDNHFDDPAHGAHFERLLALADAVVASTPRMAELVRARTGRECAVVSDPVEGPRGTPQLAPRIPAVKVVTFGNANSMAVLAERAEELRQLAAIVPVRLAVVSAPVPAVQELVARMNALAPQRLQVLFAPWSAGTIWEFIKGSDAVWIPSPNGEREAVKSPNRLLEALWAGRLAIADAIPSYAPFAAYARVGTGLVAGLVGALNDTARAEAALAEGQAAIARSHSPFAIGRAWARALGADAQALRLNLGCGDKILPGYVNVDVAEARAGIQPDVLCDLRSLAPFESGSADEVLAVHVVEHFWRWEAADVLREWVRVLKPGGRMVLECPNLQSACEAFLRDPATAAREDAAGQRSMWVFYGDPAWKDPLMVHRWGYTPETLARLMAEAGLVDVRQEPAQFKLREPRDMRVVGTKPVR